MIHLNAHHKVGLGVTFLLFFHFQAYTQLKGLPYQESVFQLSFFPGVSTNGLSSAMYFNKFSINLTSGLSAGNHWFEIASISNTHTRSSGGIQVAGMANVVGSNSYVNLTLGEEQQYYRDGERSDLKGIQLSGLMNFVRHNVQGFQLTGGMNVNNGNAQVFQFAGFANYVGQSFGGTQIAGLANNVNYGARGLQLALGFNRAKWEMDGLQLSLVNSAGMLSGVNSVQPTSRRGVQVGLVNLSKTNDGLQLGLFNKTKGFRGVQVGLVNFYHSSPYQGGQGNGKYGVPIGLINIGSTGNHVRIYNNSLFWTNLEITTGNCRNCTWTESKMPINSKFQKMNQNALIFGYNQWAYVSPYKWTIGYGFEQVLYNKSSMSAADPNNKRFFVSYGARVQHLNRDRQFEKRLNLLSVLHSEIGLKVTSSMYVFGGLNLNSEWMKELAEPTGLEMILASGSLGARQYRLWTSYTVGLQM
ncbi:LA_2272 family surface repeat-containing protein [Marinoscillum sp.]|uniref:LA_2272 family surface repeat-containing protein n=1 Tax=Marinoscillum sp. TaxID=2024838 RepID=UPI003BAC51FE